MLVGLTNYENKLTNGNEEIAQLYLNTFPKKIPREY